MLKFFKTLTLFLPALILLIFWSISFANKSYKIRYDRLISELDFDTKIISQNAENLIESPIIQLKTIVQDIDFKSDISCRIIENQLIKMMENSGTFISVKIIDTTGREFIKAGLDPNKNEYVKRTNFKVLNSDNFLIFSALDCKEGELLVSDLERLEQTYKANDKSVSIVKFAMPVFKDGELIGSVSAKYKFDLLKANDKDHNIVDFFLLSKSGDLIEHNSPAPNISNIYKKIVLKNNSDTLIESDDGIFILKKIEPIKNLKISGEIPTWNLIGRLSDEALENIKYVTDKNSRIRITSILIYILSNAFLITLFDRRQSKSRAIIREKDANYKNLFNNIEVGFAIIKMVYNEINEPIDAEFTEVNQAFRNQVRVPKKVLIGGNVIKLFPETDPRFVMTFEQVLKTGKSVTKKHYSATLDKYFEVTLYRASEKEVAILIYDITVTQQIKETLEKQNSDLSGIFESTGTGLIITDADFNIVDANNAIETILGYEKDELLNKKYFSVVPEAYKDESLARLERAKNERTLGPVEVILANKNGSELIFEVNVNTLCKAETDEVSQIILNFTDITQRKKLFELAKESEAHYHFLANNTREAVFIYKNGKIIDANTSFFEMLELDSDAIKVGLDLSEVLENFDLTKTNNERQIVELHNSSKKPIIAEVRALKQELRGETVTAFVLRDISAQKELEEKLKQARIKAEEANRLKSEFIATISHELRTPMNGIIGLSQILETTKIDDEQAEYISLIQDSSRALMSIFQDLIDVSKIELNRVVIEKTSLDLNKVANEVISLLHDSNRNGNTIDLYYDETIPHKLFGDKSKINRVLFQLVSNAEKFTKNGKIKVCIKNEQQFENKIFVLIKVSDSGIGIPADKVEMIFNKFTQVDQTSTRGYEGTGIGLNIAKGLVELMGGRISCESEVGKGSVFTIRLPLELK